MPGHCLHIELAQTLLEDSDVWEAPNWRRDAEAVNALYQGAIGPDMGYFPGADRLIGGLAHYVRTAELTRALTNDASTDIERAYALGWLTHVLADASVHKIVNRAAGLVDNGSLDRPSTAADSFATHIRVEVGLDGVRLARNDAVKRIRLTPTFNEQSIDFLQRAYHTTYGLTFEKGTMLNSHRAVARYQPAVFRFTSIIGRQHLELGISPADIPLKLLFLPTRWLSGIFARGTPVFGVTHTIAPAPWVEADVEQILQLFPSIVRRHVDIQLTDLRDINLDTGDIENMTEPYSLAVQAREDLVRRTRLMK